MSGQVFLVILVPLAHLTCVLVCVCHFFSFFLFRFTSVDASAFPASMVFVPGGGGNGGSTEQDSMCIRPGSKYCLEGICRPDQGARKKLATCVPP